MMTDSVEQLLTSRGISFIPSGKDLLIKCLNPEHEDSNPSCRVDKTFGMVHCFSCGWRHNIFKYFGIFTNGTSLKVKLLKDKLAKVTEETTSIKLPEDYVPVTKSFRGISAKTLRKFGAFTSIIDKNFENRICFPVYDITGKTVAFLNRHKISEQNPRYLVTPRGRSLPCIPPKLEEPSKFIVLVEGIFDMLNLYDNGIKQAVAALGTDTLTEKTIRDRLLAFKVQGVQYVYILFDGDKAGKFAASKLKDLLIKEGFEPIVLDLPDDKDPGDLDTEEVEQLKAYIDEDCNSRQSTLQS